MNSLQLFNTLNTTNRKLCLPFLSNWRPLQLRQPRQRFKASLRCSLGSSLRGPCGKAIACPAEASGNGEHPSLSSSYLHWGKIDVADLRFARATVVENREASVDGSARTLVLSVEDHVNFMDGRKIKHVQENPRWVDAYRVPGQLVAVRYCSTGDDFEDCSTLALARQLRAVASSPFEARLDSALLDASIIELLVSRNGDEDDRVLAELGPGCLLEVSNVVGKGYSSLLNSKIGLSVVLEDCRSLIMVGMGSHGIAPLHAALTWTPVQAHATAHRVSLFYVVESQAAAAYLVEWDAWREAGVYVHPIYLAPDGDDSFETNNPEMALEDEVFYGEHGLRGILGCDPQDAAVLISGVPGDVAAHLRYKFTNAGVAGERILFCEYT